MKHWFLILCMCYCTGIAAQQRFVKAITDPGYGKSLRILPTPDNGWVIFSMDSLKLTKFSPCGAIEWSRDYTIPFCFYHADFITTPGGFALLSRQATDGATNGALITEIDALGNISSSKNIVLSQCDLVPYSLLTDPQGNYIFYANASQGPNTTYNALCKVTPAGTVLWTHFYDLGGIWGKALATSDQGFLLRTGNRFIKTDAAGNVQWTSQANVFSMSYYSAIEVSDGYIFVTINVGMQTITFYKLNLQGNLLWGKISNYSGDLPYLRTLPGDRFASVFNENLTGSNNVPVVIEFDKDAHPLRQNAYSSNQPGIDLFGKDLTFLNDGSPAITGFAGTVPYPFCIKTDKAYQSGCDVVSTPMGLTDVAATSTFINVTKAPRNFMAVNQVTSTLPLNPSLLTWCFIPKTLHLGNDTAICLGEVLNLKNKTPDLFDIYRWSTGDTSAAIPVKQGGLYWLNAKDKCDAAMLSDTFRLMIKPALVANLGKDLVKCEDSLLVLSAPPCADCLYTWSNGSRTNTTSIEDPDTYWLKIENSNGCNSADTIQVDQVKCHCSLYLPNTFTPNQDGLNDLFKPVYSCDMETYSLRIFNRWGELLYETNNPADGWDGHYKGHVVKQDIYSYLLSYKPLVSGMFSGEVRRMGTVTVFSQR